MFVPVLRRPAIINQKKAANAKKGRQLGPKEEGCRFWKSKEGRGTVLGKGVSLKRPA